MPEREKSDPIPVDDLTGATATAPPSEEAAEAEPEPEPMTPERVSQWNAYYDVYVKWAALILVFMVACNYVTDSHVWLHLKTGQLITKQMAPVTTDVFSYTEAGRPWFNVPWLFQVGHAALYDFSYGLVPVDKIDPTAKPGQGRADCDRHASRLRRLDPVLDGLGHSQVPPPRARSLVVGRVHGAHARRGLPPDRGYAHGRNRWPIFRCAADLGTLPDGPRTLDSLPAFFQGRAFGLWLLLPIFVLWANVDESFLYGARGSCVLGPGISSRSWSHGRPARTPRRGS